MKVLTSAVSLVVLATAGCATRDYVKEQIDPVTGRVQTVEARVAGTESALKSTEATLQADIQANRKAIAEVQVPLNAQSGRIARTEAEIAKLSTATQEAVARANQAGEMARGKLVYEVVLTDEQLQFATDSAVLSKAAQAALDDFVAKLKAENRGFYIEVQGHTDKTGFAHTNHLLGERRAEAVKRYLNMNGGIPLHRLNTISYGGSKPLASNKTAEGRKQNRRVVLVVIQ